jgi:hypothetical protein
MKKNISMNLGGTIFNVDEDAYEVLERYFNSIKRKFESVEGCEDIVSDIEYRMAELLLESTKDNVVTLADVERIIEILGT